MCNKPRLTMMAMVMITMMTMPEDDDDVVHDGDDDGGGDGNTPERSKDKENLNFFSEFLL